jgi:ubiquinone/menaquinone biosynthesis C-methylase UbiE
MIRRFLRNCRKPQGLMGRVVAKGMNSGHAVISEWGLSYLEAPKGARVLDIGCGGGANIGRLLRMYPDGHVEGIDYSEESVTISRRKNAAALGERCTIEVGSVSALPYEDASFDAVIAFETIYFWPDIVDDFREVRRVLKPGGMFLICNDSCDPADDTWTSRIEGMWIYGKEELSHLLVESGFEVASVNIHERGWLCVAARAADGAPPPL